MLRAALLFANRSKSASFELLTSKIPTAPLSASAILRQQPVLKDEDGPRPVNPPLKHPGAQIVADDYFEQSSEFQGEYLLSKPHYEKSYVENIVPKHKPPVRLHDYVGFYGIQALRGTFDYVSGYSEEGMTEKKWLTRIIYLETVAGVPGMVAGMLRHLRSLRTMKRDHGWIHTLLEEAENERMHLLTFLQIRQPNPLFRLGVLLGQGVFFNVYMLAYIIWPKACHSMVGYLEEEAVKTYTHLLRDIDAGRVWKDTPAPKIGKLYWKLEDGATMKDLILAVRADEACHSYVNHTFAQINSTDPNPFGGANQINVP